MLEVPSPILIKGSVKGEPLWHALQSVADRIGHKDAPEAFGTML